MNKIILLALMVSICISQTPPQSFYGNVQCACQQFLTQGECNSNPLCSWNAVTPTQVVTIQTGYCSLKTCSQITSAKLCSTQPNCYYQQSSSADAQICFPFSGCESVVLASAQSCQSANIRCTPNTDQQLKSSCVTITSCSNLTQTQCGGATTNNEAQCFWTGSECKVIEQCSEITNSTICGQLNHSCYWSNNQCIPQTCGNLVPTSLTPQSSLCTYIVQTPFILNQIQSCSWNKTTSTCIESTPTALNINNCATNTGFYHRWVGDNTQGQCIQCNAGRHIFRNQCECKQILLQSECRYNACQWVPATASTQGYCTNNQCGSFTSQPTCSQIQSCYWNATVSPQVCQPYKQCSDIKGKTQLECYAASIFCAGSDGTSCSNQLDLKSCSQSAIYKNATSGNSTLLPSVCYNTIGKDGWCTYTPQAGNTMGTCIAINGCGSLTTKQQCDQFSNSCFWTSTSNVYSCISKTCGNFVTQKTCTYVQPSLIANVINICYWNPNTHSCMSFDNSLDFDQNSCFNNTAGTHHWSQPTNSQKGLCLPCYMSSVLNIKSQCDCTELINYTDCALAAPQCIWNAFNQKCIVQTCTNLTTQAQCLLSNVCYWKVGKNGAVGTCAAVGSPTISCSSLNGTTQQECLAQAQFCPGTSGGKCSTSINACSSFKSFYTCFGSVGTDGVCQWDEINASCSGISQCSMLTTATQCDLVKNACYWNSTACLNQTCANIYSSTSQCTYYLTTPNQNYEVKQCMLLGTSCEQSSSGLNNLTSSTCYLNSGRQAKWINGTDGKYFCSACYSQLLTVLLLILSILV